MLALVRLVAFALVASFGTASGALAHPAKPALRALGASGLIASASSASKAAECVGKLDLHVRQARQDQRLGQYEDAETGLYYNRFRYYDAEAGQYVAQDPIGLAGGLALYGYVQDPLWWLDPFGLASCAASSLPKLRGKNVAETEDLLQKNGFVRTHISNSAARNQTWKHADGSTVKIHAYGDQATKPWKTANNGHVHKYNPAGEALNDRGVPANVLEYRGISTQGKETHIGIRNPSDLPTVRGRPHGAGS